MEEEYGEKLARIDERTLNIQESLQRVEMELSQNYVSKSEFAPIRLIVYGMVGLVLTAVVGAVITLALA